MWHVSLYWLVWFKNNEQICSAFTFPFKKKLQKIIPLKTRNFNLETLFWNLVITLKLWIGIVYLKRSWCLIILESYLSILGYFFSLFVQNCHHNIKISQYQTKIKQKYWIPQSNYDQLSNQASFENRPAFKIGQLSK